jgi:LmbE family N-acetylglucosaminyl deacetylase
VLETATPLPFPAEEVDPATFFAGRVLLTAPHQDDCVLAFGATLARLGGGAHIHVAYATDGADSPEPLLPWFDERPRNLRELREEEAREAMQQLGVPPENVHFLDFPDRRLGRHLPALRRALRELAERVGPDHVVAPFRYDRHPDHLALHRAVVDLFGDPEENQVEVTEYFVYHHSRLLPRRDLRAYVRPGLLRAVIPGSAAASKRRALDCFRSQTTRMYPWQTRPNLSAQLLDEVSVTPEIFLRYDPSLAGTRVLVGPRLWIRVAHRIEPVLKRRKDQLVALLKRSVGAGSTTEARS